MLASMFMLAVEFWWETEGGRLFVMVQEHTGNVQSDRCRDIQAAKSK